MENYTELLERIRDLKEGDDIEFVLKAAEEIEHRIEGVQDKIKSALVATTEEETPELADELITEFAQLGAIYYIACNLLHDSEDDGSIELHIETIRHFRDYYSEFNDLIIECYNKIGLNQDVLVQLQLLTLAAENK